MISLVAMGTEMDEDVSWFSGCLPLSLFLSLPLSLSECESANANMNLPQRMHLSLQLARRFSFVSNIISPQKTRQPSHTEQVLFQKLLNLPIFFQVLICCYFHTQKKNHEKSSQVIITKLKHQRSILWALLSHNVNKWVALLKQRSLKCSFLSCQVFGVAVITPASHAECPVFEPQSS